MSNTEKQEKSVFLSKSAFFAYSLIAISIIQVLVVLFFNIESPVIRAGLKYSIGYSFISGLIIFLFVIVHFFNYFNFDKNKITSLLLGFSVAGIIIFSQTVLGLFNSIEGFSVDMRFRLSSFQVFASQIDTSTIKKENPKANNSIKIIGIDQETVNKYQGFPFPWNHYADLLKGLQGSSLNSIFFDIFFMDEKKNNYGVLNLAEKTRLEIMDILHNKKKRNKKINIDYRQMMKKTAFLSDVMKKRGNVFLDYPFETTRLDEREMQSKQFQERIRELNKYSIPNVVYPDDHYIRVVVTQAKVYTSASKTSQVIDIIPAKSELEQDGLEGDFYKVNYPRPINDKGDIKEFKGYIYKNDVIPFMYSWVDHPEPPLNVINKAVSGLGFANIRKETSGVNRSMPLVVAWEGRVYPNIDLLLAIQYFGVDIKKDVEVVWGKYIKIMNIPKKIMQPQGKKPRDVMLKPNAKREVKIPINDEGFMQINFIGGPFSFPSQSFQLLADDVPEGNFSKENENDAFKDQILFVAMYYATGVSKDIHASPFGDMAGIEHHANALNTIINQDFIYYSPWWLNAIIYLLLGLALGFLVPRYNMRKVMVALTAFIILFIGETFFMFNVFNYVHTFFTPFLQIVMTMIVITGYKVITEEDNVKYIRSTFSRFVSKDVVNELLSNPESLKLGGEKKDITIFFSDIRGFTTISESLSPEKLVHLLNDYLSSMTDIVLEYKGTIDKYMGDAIMAFWGAPVPEKDHAYHACLCAIKQLQVLKEMQKRWELEKIPVINIGIGLNSGPAVVGNVGSSHRMEYTVMGDTINLGSRLEGTNKVYSTEIIISEHTYEIVKDRVICRELDLIKVKGKNEPVRIYELLDIINEKDFETYKVEHV